ncbi:alpha/beta hydrolase [Halomarina salina]|uniref:Alpha/beta hydrolase n=1 Tax=Halomarina salina TaxID=1872699 RepID=A0ABD5RR04_9EURY|nr:alpha/beta hydrolase [Halomarina salina]
MTVDSDTDADSSAVRADAPHPEVQAILDVMDQQETPSLSALTPENARAQFSEMNDLLEGESVMLTQDVEMAGPDGPIPLRVYKPVDEDDVPVLVYLHGGGFVVGDLDSHDPICSILANRTEALVVSVDYRLAPEHPFPAALEDAYAAVEWAEEYAADLGGDPDRLVVGGDSAGGNLTAGVTLLARDREDGPDVDRQLLLYPAVAPGDHDDMPSFEENSEGYFLEADDMAWFTDCYVQDEIHARNEYLAPLLVRDLSGLPPASVVTAGFDPLRDEGIAYAERLDEAGVDVVHRNYDDMIHGFASMTGVVSTAEACLEDLAADVTGQFE